jgi:hypothetical protein
MLAEFLSGLAIAWLGGRQVQSGCKKMWQNGGRQAAETIKNKFANSAAKRVK